MSDLLDYKPTADANTQSVPLGAPEGMPPSAVNNVQREMMARLRRDFDLRHVNLTAGTSALYTLTTPSTIAFTDAASMPLYPRFVILFHLTNVANPRLQVNTLPARSLRNKHNETIPAGAIKTDTLYTVFYDDPYFVVEELHTLTNAEKTIVSDGATHGIVYRATDQAIAGKKTFSGRIVANAGIGEDIGTTEIHNDLRFGSVPADNGMVDELDAEKLSGSTRAQVVRQAYDEFPIGTDSAKGAYISAPTGASLIGVAITSDRAIVSQVLDEYIKLLVPIGTIFAYAGTALPGGGSSAFLWCDGTEHSGNAYPDLRTLLGSDYFVSGGNQNTLPFTTPDLRDRVLKSQPVTDGSDILDTGGSDTVSLPAITNPTGSVDIPFRATRLNFVPTVSGSTGPSITYLQPLAGSTGNVSRFNLTGSGGTPARNVSNVPKYGYVNYIIRAR